MISNTELEELSDSSRVWVFGASEPLSDCEAEALRRETARFLASWSSHGSALRGGAFLVDDTFLVVALEETADASGCSIDKLFRFAQERKLLDGSRVYYRSGAEIRSATRPEFQAMVSRGDVTAETIVVDTTVERLGEIRSGAWQKRFADSWHARAFPL